MSEPQRPEPRAPEKLGFEAIVYEKAPPRATSRYAKASLDLCAPSWAATIGHVRDWLALSMLTADAQDAGRDFVERQKGSVR